MAATSPIFSGTITASTAGNVPKTILSASQGWVGVVLNVTAVSGTTPSVVFGLQWSMDGATWADADPGRDEFSPITAPCTLARRFDVKAPYWRAYVNVTGTNASFTGSANAYY